MGKKYQTRGNDKNIPSRPVRILCVDCKSGDADYPVVGLVLEPDGTERIAHWGADGSFQTARPYPEDLVSVPTKHAFGWGVVNKAGQLTEAFWDKNAWYEAGICSNLFLGDTVFRLILED